MYVCVCSGNACGALTRRGWAKPGQCVWRGPRIAAATRCRHVMHADTALRLAGSCLTCYEAEAPRVQGRHHHRYLLDSFAVVRHPPTCMGRWRPLALALGKPLKVPLWAFESAWTRFLLRFYTFIVTWQKLLLNRNSRWPERLRLAAAMRPCLHAHITGACSTTNTVLQIFFLRVARMCAHVCFGDSWHGAGEEGGAHIAHPRPTGCLALTVSMPGLDATGVCTIAADHAL